MASHLHSTRCMRTKYKPKLLKMWTTPQNYSGSEYPDYYRSGFGQSRDSDLIERCNFSAALDALGGETPKGVIVTRSSHWAVGWVESILIHKSAYAKLRIGDRLAKEVEDYPILDEDSFSELEHEEQSETLKCYLNDFTQQVEKCLGRSLETQDEIAETVDLVSDVYFEDCGYCGTENAFVTEESLIRYLNSHMGMGKHTPIHEELRSVLIPQVRIEYTTEVFGKDSRQGIHLDHPTEAELEDAKQTAYRDGFKVIYVHRLTNDDMRDNQANAAVARMLKKLF